MATLRACWLLVLFNIVGEPDCQLRHSDCFLYSAASATSSRPREATATAPLQAHDWKERRNRTSLTLSDGTVSSSDRQSTAATVDWGSAILGPKDGSRLPLLVPVPLPPILLRAAFTTRLKTGCGKFHRS